MQSFLAKNLSLVAQSSDNNGDIRDIVILEPEGSHLATVLLLTGAILVCLIVALLLSKLLRKRKREKAPDVVAVGKLDEIEAELSEKDANEIGLEVSEVVKDFLVARFEDPIRYETAHEFLSRFSNSTVPVTKLPTSVHQNLRDFVSMSEEVKFGKAPSSKDRIPTLLRLARNIVGMAEAVNEKT